MIPWDIIKEVLAGLICGLAAWFSLKNRVSMIEQRSKDSAELLNIRVQALEDKTQIRIDSLDDAIKSIKVYLMEMDVVRVKMAIVEEKTKNIEKTLERMDETLKDISKALFTNVIDIRKKRD